MLAVSVAAFAVLCALGTWQVARMQWKEALLQSISDRVASPPVPVEEIVRLQTDEGDVDYVPVTVSGVFDHGNERHFFATHRGITGYFVYTPLRMADQRVVFVNRGFVPFDFKDKETRPESLIGGTVTVTGLARNAPADKPSFIVPDNDPAKNIYYWKDLSAMAALSGLTGSTKPLQFFIDTDDTPVSGGLPIGGVTIIDLPNNHLQYAITWYGLALALAGVVAAWLLGQRKTTARRRKQATPAEGG